MGSARRMRQRPLTVQHSRGYKMSKALELERRKKMIRRLVIEAVHKHGIEIADREGDDDAE